MKLSLGPLRSLRIAIGSVLFTLQQSCFQILEKEDSSELSVFFSTWSKYLIFSESWVGPWLWKKEAVNEGYTVK
ncbi:hypothetical protein F5Y01DRAFT_228276 [Xylaria sp. FL0043]|nr:hypothetical protein F5Y01DRAFT_228276 [Xylaria sp. FL0043]